MSGVPASKREVRFLRLDAGSVVSDSPGLPARLAVIRCGGYRKASVSAMVVSGTLGSGAAKLRGRVGGGAPQDITDGSLASGTLERNSLDIEGFDTLDLQVTTAAAGVVLLLRVLLHDPEGAWARVPEAASSAPGSGLTHPQVLARGLGA